VAQTYFIRYFASEDGPYAGIIVEFTSDVIASLRRTQGAFAAAKRLLPALQSMQFLDATPIWLDDHWDGEAEDDDDDAYTSRSENVVLTTFEGQEVGITEEDREEVRLRDTDAYPAEAEINTVMPWLHVTEKSFYWSAYLDDYHIQAETAELPWGFLDGLQPDETATGPAPDGLPGSGAGDRIVSE
jgi:hypothetical protein